MAMASITMELLQVDSADPDTNFGHLGYARARSGGGSEGFALFQGSIPAAVPAQISVYNVKLKLYPKSSTTSSGGYLLSEFACGFYRYQSTFNMLNKADQRPWKNGDIGNEIGQFLASGSVTGDSPQIIETTALQSFLQGCANGSRFVGMLLAVAIGEKTVESATLEFDYTNTGTPQITGFSPDSFDEGQTPGMTISGVNFDGTLSAIRLVGASTYNLTGISKTSTQATGTVPAGVAAGEYTVRLVLDGANCDSTGTVTVSSVTPSVTGVSSIYGSFIKHCYKQPLTITGANLAGASSCQIVGQEGQGTFSLTGVSNNSATSVSAVMPDYVPPGKYKIKLVVTDGTAYSAEIDVSIGPDWR